jgi:hypothetical protein
MVLLVFHPVLLNMDLLSKSESGSKNDLHDDPGEIICCDCLDITVCASDLWYFLADIHFLDLDLSDHSFIYFFFE